MRIYLRALGVVGLMLLMLLLGMWVGGVTAPRGGSIVSVVGSSDVKPLLIPETMESVDETPTDPPFYFHAELGAGADGAVVGREIALASRAGVRRYILSLPLPWEGEWEPIERALALVAEHAPRGRVIIELDINPPPSWLEANPSEVSSVSLNGRSFPSVGSRAWRAFAVERILAMADHVDAMASPVELVGVVLSALEKGEWFRADSYDNSEANTTAFRAWLARAYGSDEAFAEAWGAGGALLAEARVPAPPGEDGPAFLMLPVEQANADYLRYTLEDTADALGGLAESIKAKAGDGLLVYARLGPSLERGAGGVDLGRLSASRIDGIVSSVSDMDRGLGGVAGYTRAIHAALSRGKDWIVIDNTRTGIGQRNPGGEVVRPSGLRVGDLLGLYRRNFAMASLHGLSYAVSDATGTGGLHDEELWEEVGALRVASERLTSEPRDDDRVASTLSVVFDEHGGAFQRGDPSFFANALAANRDAALEAGCSLQFVLLSDVLAGRPVRRLSHVKCVSPERGRPHSAPQPVHGGTCVGDLDLRAGVRRTGGCGRKYWRDDANGGEGERGRAQGSKRLCLFGRMDRRWRGVWVGSFCVAGVLHRRRIGGSAVDLRGLRIGQRWHKVLGGGLDDGVRLPAYGKRRTVARTARRGETASSVARDGLANARNDPARLEPRLYLRARRGGANA